MSRKKGIGIVIFCLVLIIGSVFLLPFLQPGDGPDEDQDVEIIPHPYNDLNWWDLPWELARASDLTGYLIEIDRYPYRHMLTAEDEYLQAAEYISSTLKGYGLETWYEGNYNSLMAVKRGFGDDNRALVFTAYLDTELGYSYTLQYNTGACAMLTLMAEILSNYRLSIDVYLCFPSYSKSGNYAPNGDLIPFRYGANDISNYFINESVNVMGLYNFDGLMLSNNGYIAGYDPTVTYRRSDFLAELLQVFLLQGGYDILSIDENEFSMSDQVIYLQKGLPTINVHSADEIDPLDPPSDTIHSSDYNLEHVTALAQACAALSIYLSNSGNGEDIQQLFVSELEPLRSIYAWTMMSTSQRITVRVTANSTAHLALSLQNYTRYEIDDIAVTGENVTTEFNQDSGIGPRRFRIYNTGNESLTLRIVFEYTSDFDGNSITDAVQYTWPDPVPPLDWDHDGLSDSMERVVGTDVFIVDTDKDNMTDSYEYYFGLDPLADDTLEDLDLDGLTNIREHTLGTYPNSTDTDQDTMDDLWEVTFLTNPLIDDSQEDPDNDTLTNVEEFEYGSDPLSADGDYDGVLDVEEVARGMNPLSSDSDNDGLRDQLELIEGLNPLVPDYDIDIAPDGQDHNPRINSILIIVGIALIPVAIGTLYFNRRLK